MEHPRHLCTVGNGLKSSHKDFVIILKLAKNFHDAENFHVVFFLKNVIFSNDRVILGRWFDVSSFPRKIWFEMIFDLKKMGGMHL